MKTIKSLLPALAFVCAIGAVLAFDARGTVVLRVSEKVDNECEGPIEMPDGCAFSGDNICQAGVFYKYETTNAACETELRRPAGN